MQTQGLHHVTAVASDAQMNLDFYTHVLGLRLVKRTVNFDDPSSYHLYYGDQIGSPGTIITFFPFPGATRGTAGVGNVIATAYAVPEGSLDYWANRLRTQGVVNITREMRFGDGVLGFDDPDGMRLELIESASPIAPWRHREVPLEHAVRGFHSVTLLELSLEPTASMLTRQLGYVVGKMEGNRHRFLAAGDQANVVDVVVDPKGRRGVHGAGVVHHIAFRSPDDDTQLTLLEQLRGDRANVSPVMDRNYFHSIYFREPGGVLFEVATDAPGFAIDEPVESLGAALKLPAQYEPSREQIEKILPVLKIAT